MSPLFILLLVVDLAVGIPRPEPEDDDEALASSLYLSFGNEVMPSEDDDLELSATNDPDDEEDAESPLPVAFDYRSIGVVSPALRQTVGCPSCTYHAGALVLEARMTRVSEHYVRYSVQGLMNCMNKVCVGGTATNNWNFLRSSRYISRYEEQGYVQKSCKSTEEGCVCGKDDQANYPNAFNDQFAFIGPFIKPGTKEGIQRALKSGPLSTVVNRGTHATTLLGYNETKWIIQDSLGPTYGKFKDGTWGAFYESNNGASIVKHSAYPKIFYDYDRANAYYTPGDGVSEDGLVFVDGASWDVTAENTADKGLAKNKCAFLGSVCKGVVKIGEQFKLVADFSGATSGDLVNERKTQMVIYLHHQESGKYIFLKKGKKKLLVKTGPKNKASPFFSSLGRLVSYDYPDHDLSGAAMHKFSPSDSPYNRGPSEIWTMRTCMLYNPSSDLALTRVPLHQKADTIGGAPLNLTDPNQRFTVGLSEEWVLTHEGTELRFDRKTHNLVFNKKSSARWVMSRFRWNGRQVLMPTTGKALDSNYQWSDEMFKFGEKSKELQPIDCKLHTIYPRKFLDVTGSKVVTTEQPAGGWTFEYSDM